MTIIMLSDVVIADRGWSRDLSRLSKLDVQAGAPSSRDMKQSSDRGPTHRDRLLIAEQSPKAGSDPIPVVQI
jgi:hypothetical protein